MATRPRSRRKTQSSGFVSKTGVEISSCYCRKCMKNLDPKEFYETTDISLDSNGLLSICKSCINEMYDRTFQASLTIEKTILSLCRMLNIKFDRAAVDATMLHLNSSESKGRQITNGIFGIYKSKLVVVNKDKKGFENSDDAADLRFFEPGIVLKGEPISNSEKIADVDHGDVVDFWGESLDYKDYEFLQTKYNRWITDYKCDIIGEETIIKELCHIQNNIRKARLMGDNQTIANYLKRFQELMKTGGLTPVQQSANSSSGGVVTIGTIIRDMEKIRPAEWVEDHELFKDIDGLGYFHNSYVRSTETFVKQTKDFITQEIIDEIEKSLNQNIEDNDDE